MSSKHPLIEAITNKPLMIADGTEDLFTASLQYLVQHDRAEQILAGSTTYGDDFWGDGSDSWRPYIVVNGVLQIPVMGVLLNRFSYQVGRWVTGYDYIEQAMLRGISDMTVKGIALVIDSPGGEVAGCFELVDKLFGWRGEKPIRAYAADHSYSAAFAIASAAGRVAVTRSGGTGSVGVVTAHVDYSGALEQAGIKVTFIHAGKHKVDGNPYEALPKAVKDRIQARIDKAYAVFVETVARNRDMEQDAVRNTEALCYDAEDSIAVGFADVVGALDEELIAFSESLENPEGEYMTTQTTKTGDAAAAPAGIDQATHDAAVAAARAEGATAGAAAERTRINAILGSEIGKARPKAALSAALKTDMTADQAAAFLGDLAEEKTEAPKTEEKPKAKGTTTPFDKAMATGNPDVGADDDEDKDKDAALTPAAQSATILSDFRKASGRPEKKTA
jgi:signal peptide peptidase SppA